MSEQQPRFAAGDCVSRDLRDGAVTVEVRVADRFHITCRDTDDIWESAAATVFRSLTEGTAHWRPTTDEEITAFKARFPRDPVRHRRRRPHTGQPGHQPVRTAHLGRGGVLAELVRGSC